MSSATPLLAFVLRLPWLMGKALVLVLAALPRPGGHNLPANPESNRPEGLPCLARMARQYHAEPAASAGAERLSSLLPAVRITTSRAPWRTTLWSMSFLPWPILSDASRQGKASEPQTGCTG